MSNIKLAWTQAGQIIGDFMEAYDGSNEKTNYWVENPVFVSPGPQGLNMMPVLMFSNETRITLTPEDFRFNAQLFEPIPELRNAYSEQFGSGIQLFTR